VNIENTNTKKKALYSQAKINGVYFLGQGALRTNQQ
jgi:hypothetical protein